MSLDERLRQGLEGLDALEGMPPESVVDAVIGRGRRSRWTRRLVAGAVTIAVAVAGLVVAPRALDALRSVGERRPAVPGPGVGVITTVAGTGVRWSSGDDGPATRAELEYPMDLDFDGRGNLYILEHGEPSNPPRVRKVDPTGRITTVVGPGAAGEAADLILGTTFGPSGLAVDADGNVYVGGGDGPDIDNRVIRIDPSGNVTTVAGTSQPGSSGDGGPATEARLQGVWDVAVDLEGNVYISGRGGVRRVDADGVISTIVGGGKRGFSGDGGPAADARIDGVTGVSADDVGNLYFIDYGNRRIRRIAPDGIITTVAGNGQDGFSGDGGPATEASFSAPEHLWADSLGNVYIADTYNRRIRKVDANGIITTIAGNGRNAFSGDGGPATSAGLAKIAGVAVGPDGDLYIADSAHDRVRRVVL
jgi:hypothetical protein